MTYLASDAVFSTRNELMLMGIGLSIGVGIVCLLLIRWPRVRQRTLWLAFAALVVAATVVWDGIEVRTYYEQFYWRSDWDWEVESGGVVEWTAAIALYVVPVMAVAFVYAAMCLAISRRSGSRFLRWTVYALGVPVGLCLAFVLGIAIFAHPLLFYPERTSLALPFGLTT